MLEEDEQARAGFVIAVSAHSPAPLPTSPSTTTGSNKMKGCIHSKQGNDSGGPRRRGIQVRRQAQVPLRHRLPIEAYTPSLHDLLPPNTIPCTIVRSNLLVLHVRRVVRRRRRAGRRGVGVRLSGGGRGGRGRRVVGRRFSLIRVLVGRVPRGVLAVVGVCDRERAVLAPESGENQRRRDGTHKGESPGRLAAAGTRAVAAGAACHCLARTVLHCTRSRCWFERGTPGGTPLPSSCACRTRSRE